MIIFNPVVVIVDRIVYNNINIIIVVGNLGDAIMSDINVLLEKAVNETAELSDGEVFGIGPNFGVGLLHECGST